MTTKEHIHAEIEHLGEESLLELHKLIQDFLAAKAAPRKPGILAKLKDIKIEAPPDFAANLDLYMSGEKRVGEDIH
jgi:hypothetical protein